MGNKLTQSDALLHTTTWTYDYYGRVLTRTLPEGMSESFHYDDANRTVNHTDFNGKATTSITNAMGRTDSIIYHDGKVETYTYWANGQVHKVTDQHGVTETVFDDRDRLSYEIKPDGTRLDYAYDAVGNREQVKVTRGTLTTVTDYTFDALNRLQTVTDASGKTQYTYYDNGNLDTVTFPNGMQTDYDYNTVNQLTHLTTKNALGEVLTSYTYGLDDTGRREDIAEANGRHTDYTYDNLYRLTDEIVTDATNGDYEANYIYDWVGNRTYETVDGVQTAYTYDLNDRLTSQGGTVYTHDDNGNTKTETIDSAVTTYTYDAKNKLTTVDKAGVVTGYAYDANGIRTSKTEAGVTTQFVVDINRDYAQVLEEVVGDIATAPAKVTYSYGHDLLNQDRAGNFRFYAYDGLGSTRALTDDAGAVTDTYDYEAFGEVLNSTGESVNAYKYTGEQEDAETGNYYLRARYLDPSIGRFTQQDTYMGNNSDPVSLHKYLYANADPVMYTDPTGNFSIGGMMSTLNVMSTLASTAQTTYSVFQIATGEEGVPTAKQLGSALIFNMIGGGAGKVIGLFGKQFVSQFSKAPGCSKNSFSAGTSIQIKDGVKEIEEIAIGDLVWSTNPVTGKMELKPVIHLIQGEKEYELFVIKFDTGETVTVTAEHPFFANDVWINAGELRKGDGVSVIESNNIAIIIDIESINKVEKVYNLTVDGYHTFHVGNYGYLVHNANIYCSKAITAVFPNIKFKGLVNGRNVSKLTGNEIYNAFSQTGYKLSNHAIDRIKHPRTRDMGFNTLEDIAKIFNKGTKVDDRGDVAFLLRGMKAVVDPKTLRIITIRPIN